MASKILIQMSYLNAIGGIETAIETLVRTFKDKDITVVINATQDGVWAKRYHQIRAVYSIDGIAPTLCAGMGEGGGVVPKIMEYKTWPKTGQATECLPMQH